MHALEPGVRNAAQRKLLDELGIQAEHVPVDQFVPVGRMLYKAPSDGKWGEHECMFLNDSHDHHFTLIQPWSFNFLLNVSHDYHFALVDT